MKQFLLSALLIVAAFNAQAKEIMFHSVDGHFYIVQFDYNPATREVTYTNAKQTLRYSNVESLDDTAMLKQRFLKLVYSTTNKEGNKEQHYVLITVNRNTPYEAAHILTRVEGLKNANETEEQARIGDHYYIAYPELTGDGRNECNLNVRFETHIGMDIYTDETVYTAVFDHNRGVFANTYETLQGNHAAPVIDIKTMRYCYMNNLWYQWNWKKGTFRML